MKLWLFGSTAGWLVVAACVCCEEHPEPIAKKRGIARQTPRMSVTIKRAALAKRPLGRNDFKPFNNWNDGQSRTELNFKFYRQSTNKIVGISDETADFLNGFF